MSSRTEYLEDGVDFSPSFKNEKSVSGLHGSDGRKAKEMGDMSLVLSRTLCFSVWFVQWFSQVKEFHTERANVCTLEDGRFCAF